MQFAHVGITHRSTQSFRCVVACSVPVFIGEADFDSDLNRRPCQRRRQYFSVGELRVPLFIGRTATMSMYRQIAQQLLLFRTQHYEQAVHSHSASSFQAVGISALVGIFCTELDPLIFLLLFPAVWFVSHFLVLQFSSTKVTLSIEN